MENGAVRKFMVSCIRVPFELAKLGAIVVIVAPFFLFSWLVEPKKPPKDYDEYMEEMRH